METEARRANSRFRRAPDVMKVNRDDDGGNRATAPVLPYLPPPKPDSRTPSPLAAALLCLPGVACWCWFGLVVLSMATPVDVLPYIDYRVQCLVWGLAIVTALASISQYRGRPKPWYVKVCLTVNGAGLAFTALMIFLFVLLFVTFGALLFG
jgi:hypothetical protein